MAEDDPLVGVIMGSDSDFTVMSEAAAALAEFEVPFEGRVVSAHRTPEGMLDYSRAAAGRGLRVIIAGAGGAAHLPGMVAALTPLPVIGVPVPPKRLSECRPHTASERNESPAALVISSTKIAPRRNAVLSQWPAVWTRRRL